MSAKRRWAIANGAWDGVSVRFIDGRSLFVSRAVLVDPESVRFEDPERVVIATVLLADVIEVVRDAD